MTTLTSHPTEVSLRIPPSVGISNCTHQDSGSDVGTTRRGMEIPDRVGHRHSTMNIRNWKRYESEFNAPRKRQAYCQEHPKFSRRTGSHVRCKRMQSSRLRTSNVGSVFVCPCLSPRQKRKPKRNIMLETPRKKRKP
jgi:hypothetical protein